MSVVLSTGPSNPLWTAGPVTKPRAVPAGAVEPPAAPKPAPASPADPCPSRPCPRPDRATVPPPTLADRLRWAALIEAHLCPPPHAHAKPAPEHETPEPFRAPPDTPTLGEVRPAPERPEVDRRVEITERYERAFQFGLHIDLIA